MSNSYVYTGIDKYITTKMWHVKVELTSQVPKYHGRS
jgi:hypothetical protein